MKTQDIEGSNERGNELLSVDVVKPEKSMLLSKTLDIKLCAAGYVSDSSQDLASSDSEDRESSGILTEDNEIGPDMMKNNK